MRRLVIVLWLTLVWVTLWESLSWANLAGGVLVSAAVLYVIPPRQATSPLGFRPLAAIRLVLHFLSKLIEASALMAWEVVTPRNRVNPAVVAVTLTTRVAGIVTAVANMVSLTPGTVTLEIDEVEMTLFIHVLHLKTLEQTRASVLRLEDLTLDAFPPRSPDEDPDKRRGAVV